MDTAWDTGDDAAAFAAAMASWNDGNVATSVATDGTHVRLVFAANEDIRTRLDAALARA